MSNKISEKHKTEIIKFNTELVSELLENFYHQADILVNESSNTKREKIASELFESDIFTNILKDYFNKLYISEHQDYKENLLNKQKEIDKKEAELSRVQERIKQMKDTQNRTSLVESYINRNNPFKKKELNESKPKAKELNESQSKEITAHEDQAVRKFIFSNRTVEFIKESIRRGKTLEEALIENNVERYTRDNILRGVNTLSEGKIINANDYQHLV